MEATLHSSIGPTSRNIADLADNVSRPKTPLPFCRDLGGIPGRLGPLEAVRTLVGMMRHGDRYFQRLVHEHGPIFRTMVGANPAVVFTAPDALLRLVRNDGHEFSCALAWVNFTAGLNSSGLLLLDNEPHKDVRRLLQPAFAAPALSGYVGMAQEVFSSAIETWCRQGHVSFKAAVREVFAEASARIFLGIEAPEEVRRLNHATGEIWQGVLALRPRSALSISWRRARRGVDEMWSILKHPRSGGQTLLARFRSAEDQAPWLNDGDERLRLFIGVMLGAFDTTASGIAAVGYLLAKHPEWQERLREQGRSLGPRPSHEALKGLSDYDLVWKEALRLFPVAQIIRQTLREVHIGGTRIPAGTLVHGLSGLSGRDARYWSDPERFDPERFADGRAEDRRHKAIYLPFGAGAHACVGAQLAGAEMRAFLHELLYRVRFRLRRDYEARHGYWPVGILSGDVVLDLEPVAASNRSRMQPSGSR